jgi:hypothetical protein
MVLPDFLTLIGRYEVGVESRHHEVYVYLKCAGPGGPLPDPPPLPRGRET